jgi:hypothetical protein
VALAFFDGQALNHLGARAFYGALYRRMGIRKPAAATLEDRLADAEAERAYLEEVLAVLAEEDPFGQRASGMKRHLDALRLLRAAAFRHSGEIIQQLIPLRINLQKMESAGADPAAVAEAREGVARMRAEELAWNTVVRGGSRRSAASWWEAPTRSAGGSWSGCA